MRVRVDAESSLSLLRGEVAGVSITADMVRLLNVSVSGEVGIYTDSFRFILPNVTESGAAGNATGAAGGPRSSNGAPTIDAPLAVSLVCRMTEADVNNSPPVKGVRSCPRPRVRHTCDPRLTVSDTLPLPPRCSRTCSCSSSASGSPRARPRRSARGSCAS